jgi:hypothetical protein
VDVGCDASARLDNEGDAVDDDDEMVADDGAMVDDGTVVGAAAAAAAAAGDDNGIVDVTSCGRRGGGDDGDDGWTKWRSESPGLDCMREVAPSTLILLAPSSCSACWCWHMY